MDISIYSKVNNNKSFNVGNSVANQNKDFDSVHNGTKKEIVTKTADTRNLNNSTPTEEYDLSGDNSTKTTDVNNYNSEKYSNTNTDVNGTDATDNSTTNSNPVNNNQTGTTTTSKDSTSNGYQNGVDNQNSNGNQTAGNNNGYQNTSGNGNGSNGGTTNNGFNGIGNNGQNGTGTDINNNGGTDAAGSKSIVNPETNKITVTTLDENGKEVTEEISVEEFREKLRKDGLTDADIDRVIDGVIQLVDLYKEIEADSDNTRRRRLLAAQYIKALELDFDTLDDLAEQIETDQAALDKLIEEKQQKESYESYEYEAVQNLIKSITGDGGYLNDPVAWEYTDEDGNIKYTFEEPQELKLGIMNHSSLYDASDDTTTSKYTPKTFKELFPDSEYYDQIVALATKEEKGIFTKTTVYKWDNNSDAQIKFLDDLHKKYGTDSENRDKRLEEINSEIEELYTKIEENQAYLDYINGRLDYSMEYIDPYIYQSDYAANSHYNGSYIEKYDMKNAYKEEREADELFVGLIYLESKEQVVDALAAMINGEITTDGFAEDCMLCVNAEKAGEDSATIFNHYMNFIDDMSDDEKGVFNYIYNTQGYEEAFKYLEGISTELDTRVTLRKQAEDEEFARNHPVIASIASVFITPIEGLSAACASLNSLITGDKIWRIDVYSSGDVYRNTIAADIAEDHPTLSFIYSTGMSMVDTAVLIGAGLITGGAALPVISATLMGSRAYVSTLNDALDRGISDGKAIALAFSAAVVETAMESWSAGHLLNLEGKLGKETIKLTTKISTSISNPALANVATKGFYVTACTVSQGLCEGEEEFATEILNYACDYFIAEDKSKYTASMEKYMKMGYTTDEAFTFTMNDLKEDAEMAFLGGFVSGCCFGGFTGIKTTYDMSTTLATEIKSEMANTNNAVAFSNALNAEFNVEVNNDESMYNTAPLPALSDKTSITTKYEKNVSQKELDAAVKAIEKVIIKFSVFKKLSTFQSLEKIGNMIISKNYKDITIFFGIRKTLKQHSMESLATAFEIVYNEEIYLLKMDTEKIINSIIDEKNLSKEEAVKLLTKYSNGFIGINSVSVNAECQKLLKDYTEEEIKTGIDYYKALQSSIKDLNVVLDILCKKYNSDINSAISKIERYITTCNLNTITRENGARDIIANMSYDNVCEALSRIKYDINQQETIKQNNILLNTLWSTINRNNCNYEAITLLYNALSKQLQLNNKYAERYINQLIDLFNFNKKFSIVSNTVRQGFFSSPRNKIEIGKKYIKIGSDGSLFHELGHAFFNYFLGEIPPSNWSQTYNAAKNNSLKKENVDAFNNKVRQISQDVYAKSDFAYKDNLAAQGLTEEQYRQKLKAEYTSSKFEKIFKETKRLEELGVKDVSSILVVTNDIDAIVMNTIEAEKAVIRDNIWRTEYGGYTAVSDIIDAVYLGKNNAYYTRYGHGDTYYGGNTVLQFHEVIANYSDLAMHGNTECIELLEKILGADFINTVHTTFEKMLNINYVPKTIKSNQTVTNLDSVIYMNDSITNSSNNIMIPAKSIAFYDMEKLVNSVIDTHNVDLHTALDYIKHYVDRRVTINQITNDISVQKIFNNYNRSDLIDGYSEYKEFQSNVSTVEWAIRMIQEKHNCTYERAVQQISVYIKTGDEHMITRYGDARKLITSMDKTKLQESYLYIRSNITPSVDQNTNNTIETDISSLKYIISQIQVGNNFTYEKAIHQVENYIKTGDSHNITRTGEARNIAINMGVDRISAALNQINNEQANTGNSEVTENKTTKVVDPETLVLDVRSLVESSMTMYNMDVNTAINYVKQYIDGNIDISLVTNDIGIQNTIKSYDKNDLLFGLDVYGVNYAIDQIQQKYNLPHAAAVYQIQRYINKGEYKGITQEGNARSIIVNISADRLNKALAHIDNKTVEEMNSLYKANTIIISIQNEFKISKPFAIRVLEEYLDTKNDKFLPVVTAANMGTVNIEEMRATVDFIKQDLGIDTNYIENKASIDLKNEIIATIDPNLTEIQKARKAYIELNRRVNYDATYLVQKNNRTKEREIFYGIRSFNELKGTSVVCSGWSYLYAELLKDIGFDKDNITIKGGTSHKWVEIKMSDGNIIIADATDARHHSNDLANCKAGFRTVGFFYTNPKWSGVRLVNVDEKNSPGADKAINTQWEDDDRVLKYCYTEDIVSDLGRFKNFESVKDDPEKFIFEDSLPGKNMDGMDAYTYYNKVVRILESDISNYKISYMYNKLLDGNYETIASVIKYDDKGNVSNAMLIGRNMGKVNFDSIEAYNQYLKLNLSIEEN